MRVVFSGAFPSENPPTDAAKYEGAAIRWQCCICYSWNEASAPTDTENEAQVPSCRLCSRPQRPAWLWLGNFDFQVQLGSLLTLSHTEQQQQQQHIGVVVAIDHVAKQLHMLSVRRSNHVNTDERLHEPHQQQQQQLQFKEMVLTQQEMRELEPFSHTSDEASDWNDSLTEYGICGDCRRVFHAFQVDLQSKFANEELLRSLSEEIATLQMHKLRQIREKSKCVLVLETTSEFHAKQQQLQHARRQLEFLNPLFCPFCGWRASSE